MYESFFELKCKPFSLLPDPDFLFLSNRHSIALSLLEYSLTGQAGFCVITGEVGSGKTTLVRAFLNRVGREFSVGLISNTHQHVRDIAGWALTAFGQKQASTNPAEVYQELMAYLIAEYGAGRQCILIVDEAQNLSVEALEELRLLSNINSGKDLLLQILLVGQPELLDKLKRPELRQFAQRIAVSHHLGQLTYAETRQYVDHRLSVAGAKQPVFTEMAVGAIQYFSGGVPRLINSICDLCLVYAFADGTKEVGEPLVFRVIADRQLSGIAPFAQTTPVDDPSVREKISAMAGTNAEAKVEAKPAEETVKAQAAESDPKASVPEPVRPILTATKMAGSPPERAEPFLERPAAVADAVVPPALSTESVRPIAFKRRAAVSRIEPDDRPTDERDFDGEDQELLLTVEADKSEELPKARLVEPSTVLNGAHGPRVVALHAEPADRLPVTGSRVSAKSDTERQFPVIESSRAGAMTGGDSLRVEETLLQAAPGGTAKPSERSWWRRAFRRER
jgi:type II secretory pathway predicted ATPase ExeA